jgi:hypothetical protein
MLWLEDASMDASRRAAAALRNATAMLTTSSQGSSVPLHSYAASPTIEKEQF